MSYLQGGENGHAAAKKKRRNNKKFAYGKGGKPGCKFCQETFLSRRRETVGKKPEVMYKIMMAAKMAAG